MIALEVEESRNFQRFPSIYLPTYTHHCKIREGLLPTPSTGFAPSMLSVFSLEYLMIVEHISYDLVAWPPAVEETATDFVVPSIHLLAYPRWRYLFKWVMPTWHLSGAVSGGRCAR